MMAILGCCFAISSVNIVFKVAVVDRPAAAAAAQTTLDVRTQIKFAFP